ncbi:DMT family transporter [Permianibacter sp. IMCC34836]|uniref:DMT family transporter n=1 Tax=Permianibacter fluminis TaxID=2738515 RepID=UPI00155218E0|nr:DMT family transporter [Permianibacter fluminis]NQD37676.1 DMT family transporter [Permianibacter fluminis]
MSPVTQPGASLIARGTMLLLLSEMVFTLLGALVKYLAPHYSNSQIVFFRNFFALLFLLPYLLARGKLVFKADKLRFHFLRSTTGISSMYLYFYCLGVLPLGEVTLLAQTAPIWIPVIAYFWLGDEFKKRYLFSGLIGITGVVLVIRPDADTFSPAFLLGLLGAMLAAGSKVTIRRMSDSETAHMIVFYFSLISTVITAVPAFIQWRPIVHSDWLAMLGLGITAALGQMLMTRAFMLAPPSRIGAWSYTQVVFAFAFGWLLWREPIQLLSLFGALLIIMAGLTATGILLGWWQRWRQAMAK